MKLRIQFEEKDDQAIKNIVSEQSQRSLVKQRVRKNVDGSAPKIDKELLWKTQIMCLMTTRQPSGPKSAVNRFLSQRPFPLSLEQCKKHNTEDLIGSCISSFRKIRFTKTIPTQAASNLGILEAAKWNELLGLAQQLRAQRVQQPHPAHEKLEREAALHMARNFKGFGPKQSRNFWQDLALTRFEFVLDSRVLGWLRKLEMPFPLASEGLGNEDYYCWVSDILRDLCAEADILPCVFDAAVFASYDKEEWPDETSE